MDFDNNSKQGYIVNFTTSERKILLIMGILITFSFVAGLLLYAMTSDAVIRGIGISLAVYSLIVFLSDWRHNLYFFNNRKVDKSLENIGLQLEKMSENANLLIQIDLTVFLTGILSTILTGLIWVKPFVLGASLSLSFLSAIKLSFDLFNNWRRSESLRKLKSK